MYNLVNHSSNENINVSYYMDNNINKESHEISNLLYQEEQDNYPFNDISVNKNDVDEDNDNLQENEPAPTISNNNNEVIHDYSNDFYLLNSSNFQSIKLNSKDIDFNNSNNNIIYDFAINEKEREIDNETKKFNFQRGDYITPVGDNDCIENSNNNLNIISSNNSRNVNIIDTPENPIIPTPFSNLTKINVLSASSQSNSQLNTPAETLSPGKQEEVITKTTPKKTKKRRRSKSKSTPKANYKLEGIRKKIKSRLHKRLKIFYNKKLKKCGSKMFFDFLPHSFISDVSVIKNKSFLNLTMRALLTMEFGIKAKDKEKLRINKTVLNYLDSNPDIRIQSGVDKYLNSYYKDIIKEYIDGNMFEEDINELKEEKMPQDYIDKYFNEGKQFVDFYENDGKRQKAVKIVMF